jgi:hypothetical protein
MMTDLTAIAEDSLSVAWAKALIRVQSRKPSELSPLVVSVTSFPNGEPTEDASLRKALDAFLVSHAKPMPSSGESASTIFPYRSWLRQGRPPRADFFDWYLKRRLPSVRARNPKNVYGTYFERMIGFSPDPGSNQLENIIVQWHRRATAHRPRPRRSALQVIVGDPLRDLTGQALRGFPCLQQVSFSYDDSGGLGVSAYYPTQYIVDRAYGNYLGLSHLGAFMAHELGLSLVRLNCIVTHPTLGTPSKTAIHAISDMAHDLAES